LKWWQLAAVRDELGEEVRKKSEMKRAGEEVTRFI
jgi:hypothetical protein